MSTYLRFYQERVKTPDELFWAKFRVGNVFLFFALRNIPSVADD